MKSGFIDVDCSVLLTPSFADADAFSGLIEDFLENLPEFRPEHWGFVEPINLQLTMAEVRNLLGDTENSIMWKRKSTPKGWGGFKKRTYPVRGPQSANHGMYVKAETQKSVDALIRYLQHLAVRFGVQYAFCDSVAAEYKMVGFKNGFAPTAGNIHVFTHTLSKKLPDILWAQIFGPAYVKLFGLEKLMSAPAYRVEQLGPETVYIQLTESLFDLHERYAEVDAVRDRVKNHLDDNIFFRPGNSADHVYKTPTFQFPQ
ncbi:hypothetical protein [Achromobacter sp. UBA2119]|uniref:hypothetical protein n=1 Tax=Achromobacter sp. UBA2119 TaxID=1945911 RepID=UPI00257F1668|nr:hypothetical protein [Achromobacter sp. UBA2119]